jgi:hypothetical protein
VASVAMRLSHQSRCSAGGRDASRNGKAGASSMGESSVCAGDGSIDEEGCGLVCVVVEMLEKEGIKTGAVAEGVRRLASIMRLTTGGRGGFAVVVGDCVVEG